MNRYYQCQHCGEAYRVPPGDEIECPSCKGSAFISMPASPFPKGSTAGLFNVPDELEETLGEELRDTFDRLCTKMVAGKKEHSDESLELPISALLEEINEELLDVFGWGVIARRKVNVLRGVVKILEQRIDELHERANPLYEVTPGAAVPENLKVGEAAHGQIYYYEPRPAWQSIETAPKDGTSVLLFHGGRLVSAWSGDSETGEWLGASSFAHEPTHWHPLPDPPDASFYQGPKK